MLGNVFFFSFLFFCLIQKYRKTQNLKIKFFYKFGFVIVLSLLFNVIRTSYTDFGLKFLIFIGCLLLYLFLFHSARTLKFFFVLLLILSPLTIFTIIKTSFTIHQNNASIDSLSPKSIAPIHEPHPIVGNQRVIWLLFDELDYDYVFGHNRPSDLKLKYLDELKNISVSAIRAYSPTKSTILSIPSYFTGYEIINAQPVNFNQAILTLKDSQEKIIWGDAESNLFSKINLAGFHTGISGWYLPYCRLYPSQWEKCQFISIADQFNSEQSYYFWKMMEQIKSFFPFNRIFNKIKGFQIQFEEAKSLVVNPELDFIYIHWPIPHLPGFYNKERKQIYPFLFRSNEEQYINNLALVEEVMGSLIERLKEKHLFEDSVIIVSADHGFREKTTKNETNSTQRIPLLIKLKGQNAKPLEITQSFNVIIMHDMIFALLKGEIQTSEQLQSFIIKNSRPEKPTN